MKIEKLQVSVLVLERAVIQLYWYVDHLASYSIYVTSYTIYLVLSYLCFVVGAWDLRFELLMTIKFS